MKNYTCPMHPEVLSEHAGHCPKCGMDLVIKNKVNHQKYSTEDSYKPLIVILLLILLPILTLALRDIYLQKFSFTTVMNNFMAGFFLVFSGFKLLDLKGFASGYFTYDILAKRVFSYGYIYPFLELSLGLLYLLHINYLGLYIFTFILMAFSGIGVAIKIARHEKFQCACLGTFLKVPLTKVTLIEDFGMALMAILMLILK